MGSRWKWINKDGRLGGPRARIHWFDLLVLAITLAFMARVISILWPQDKVVEMKVVRLEILVEKIPSRQARSIREGHWVQDNSSGDYLGKIIKIQERPAREIYWGEENLVVSVLPDTLELMLIIEGRGEVRKEEGIYLGRKPVRVGERKTLRTLYTVFEGRIDYLTVVKDAD